MINNHTHIQPPRWPLRFLRVFLRKEFLEEIEGDMEEIFQENIEHYSTKQARRMYAWQVLKLLRPNLIRNIESFRQFNHYPMFKNYFKVSVRGLMKTPVNSFINIFGLAMAIGICVLGYAFARWTYNTDQFHKFKNEVYLVTFFANREGKAQQFGNSPRPLGEVLRDDFASVRKVCRIDDRGIVVKNDERVFNERARFTDPEFLQMMTFPMKWGTASSLKDMNSIILSEEAAIKYFGDENPIGRDVLVKFSEASGKAFKVTGVAAPFPEARTFAFDFLINFENLRQADASFDPHDWSAVVNATFIQVDRPSDLRSISAGLEKYRKMQNDAVDPEWAITSFGFEPLATLHRHASEMRNDISASSDGKYDSIIFLGIICTFMLALACFNYINIAITTAAKRLKEIGVRKTIGASRRVVIFQFLSENIIVAFFAMIVGIMLGTFVFIPWLERLNHFDTGFTLRDGDLWIYLPIILLITGIASGLYPSIYISRFQVAGILKGSVRFGQKNPLTKLFLGIQLVLACVLITTGVMFTQNTNFMSKRGWGYEQHGALYVSVPDAAAFEKMDALVSREPKVISIAGSKHHLGKSNGVAVLHLPDRQVEVDELAVDAGYLETMQLQLQSGRSFVKDSENDKRAVVVNETFATQLGVDPVGMQFRLDSVQYEVIGVVKDFHSYSFFRQLKPTIFRMAEKESFRYLSVRVLPGDEMNASIKLKETWAKLYPEIPFEGGFQEDVWGNYYEQLSIHSNVWRGFASIAIILAALGLYGLVSLNVAGRVKEFSIRKVLGAGISNLTGNIGAQYVLLFVVALGLGAPLSYKLNVLLFDTIYNYHMPMTFSGVGIAASILLLVLIVTVSSQIKKVLQSNPVEGLKIE